MNFRTELNIPKSSLDIDYKSNYLALGSCFADEIGNRMASLKFDMLVNPSGIVFNPVSLALQIQNALLQRVDENSILKRDDTFFSYDYHSKLNASSKEDLIGKLQLTNKTIFDRLKEADVVFVTFGTAWVYELAESKHVVANCHKINQSNFNKKLLTFDTCFDSFKETMEQLQKINPTMKWIFTVSPVRHIKDGLHENNLSKSTLLLLVSKLCHVYDNAYYFPAYELILDDLRDYRFFKDDLIHPSEMAVNYVFEKFVNAYCNTKTLQAITIQHQIMKLQKHQSIVESNESVIDKIDALKRDFSNLMK